MTGTSPQLNPIKSGSVKSRVVDAIREAIFSGRFLPGSSLREAHLAADLGVSQASVREALITLEHTGLVVRSPNRETTVTRLTAAELRERCTLRVMLEGLAGVEAAARMREEDFADLSARLDAIHAALAADSYFDYGAADLNFHRAIWRLSGNQTLCHMLELITVPLFAFLSIRRSRSLHNLAAVVKSHDPILAALRSKDEAVIREAIRAHIEDSYSGMEAALDPEARNGNSSVPRDQRVG